MSGTYHKEHRKKRKTTMVYEDQLSWIARNYNREKFKSEAEFICHLLALGMQQHTEDMKSKAEDQ